MKFNKVKKIIYNLAKDRFLSLGIDNYHYKITEFADNTYQLELVHNTDYNNFRISTPCDTFGKKKNYHNKYI